MDRKKQFIFLAIASYNFYTNIQKVFYLPRYSIFILIWTIIVLSPMVILLNCIYKCINISIADIFKKYCKY